MTPEFYIRATLLDFAAFLACLSTPQRQGDEPGSYWRAACTCHRLAVHFDERQFPRG